MQLLANIFIFLTFFMIPFLGGNHLPLYYISIDRFWIEGIFGLLLVISITLSFMRNKTISAGFFKYLAFFLPFFTLSIISLLYSWNQFNTVVWISILVWAIGCVYLYAILPNKDVCLIGLVVGAVFVSISAILQLKILFPNLLITFQHGLNAQILREQSGIPFASYMYHNILGGYLAFIFPLTLYFGIYKKSLVSLAAAIIIATGVVITSTRIGLGITLLMYIITAAIIIFKGKKKDLLKVGLVGVITVIAVLLILHSGNEKNDVTNARSIIIQKTKAVSADLSTLNTRTDIWKNGINAFRHSPIIGFGAGSFEYAYRKYFDGNSYTGVAHSTLVKIAVELGAIGLICFLFYLVGVGLAARHGFSEPRKLFVTLSLCAGFLFSMVDFSFDVTSHVVTFVVLSTASFLSVPAVSQNVGKQTFNIIGSGVFLLAAICLAANFLFGLRVNTFKASLQSGDLLMEESLPLNALYQYRDATDMMPLSNEGYMRALSALWPSYQAETSQQTRQEMLKEIKEYVNILEGTRDADSGVYFVLGKSHALIGNNDKADKYFRLALDHYPSSGRYIHEIASHYASQENYDKAMQVIRSFDPFIEKHRGPNNPRGIFVYKIRDLEADIHYKNGDSAQAFKIAHKNCQDAENNTYVITSSRTRTFTSRDQFAKYLKKKADFYGSVAIR